MGGEAVVCGRPTVFMSSSYAARSSDDTVGAAFAGEAPLASTSEASFAATGFFVSFLSFCPCLLASKSTFRPSSIRKTLKKATTPNAAMISQICCRARLQASMIFGRNSERTDSFADDRQRVRASGDLCNVCQEFVWKTNWARLMVIVPPISWKKMTMADPSSMFFGSRMAEDAKKGNMKAIPGPKPARNGRPAYMA